MTFIVCRHIWRMYHYSIKDFQGKIVIQIVFSEDEIQCLSFMSPQNKSVPEKLNIN